MARHTTAYVQTPASSALTACWTAPPILTVSTWTCQLRFGSFSIAIMQLTDTMDMPSTIACPDAGNSAYVARPSMSDMSSPESSTAALTACSACAASGTSADRVILENPTPLTATLHLFSHIPHPSFATSTASRCCARLVAPPYWRGQLQYAVPSLARGKLLFLRALSFW